MVAIAVGWGCAGKTQPADREAFAPPDAGGQGTDAGEPGALARDSSVSGGLSDSAGLSDSGGLSDSASLSDSGGLSDSAGGSDGIPVPATLYGAEDVETACIAIDSTAVYWGQAPPNIYYGGVPAAPGVAIMKMSRAGGVPQTLASFTSQLAPHDIAVDATSVYWTMASSILPSPVSGFIMKVPIGGGTPVTLASTRSPGFIAVDSTSVYWTDAGTGTGDGTVMKATLDGKQVTTLAQTPLPGDIVVDSTNVYWLDNDPNSNNASVRMVPLRGGAPTTLAVTTAEDLGAMSLAVDATGIYWTMGTYDGAAIMRLPRSPGPAGIIATGRGFSFKPLALRAGSIYWADGRGLMKVPFVGGLPVLVAAGVEPSDIAVDSTGVYWTQGCTDSPYCDGGGGCTPSCIGGVLGLPLP
jgi:hypothetical protein